MIKVENIDVWGFEHAVRGARNPMNSWDKSDSYYEKGVDPFSLEEWRATEITIGDNDMDLLKRLYNAGVEHRTYGRMIQVWMDITAPLYLWKELDRYTVGKSQVSTSTMHKIHAKEFTLDDFSTEHLTQHSLNTLQECINTMNFYRNRYLETKDKNDWWQMIQLLPSSYNQKRTINMTYEVVFKIINERTGHKLDEWNEFVEILKDLPYVKEIIK